LQPPPPSLPEQSIAAFSFRLPFLPLCLLGR
jgi:hypothetical protein